MSRHLLHKKASHLSLVLVMHTMLNQDRLLFPPDLLDYHMLDELFQNQIYKGDNHGQKECLMA